MIGDHIRISRGGRWLHGIDCGDATVLHAADAAPQAPCRIRRSYRPDLEAGADAVEVVVHRARVYGPEAVVARAFSRAADPALAAMFADSEAFAFWCKTGRLPPRPANVAVSVPGASRARAGGGRPRPASARRKAAAKPRRPAREAKPARKAAGRGRAKRKPGGASRRGAAAKAGAGGRRKAAPRRRR
jgi:hypothetical protein